MDRILNLGDEPASLVARAETYPGMKGRWEVDLIGPGRLVHPARSFSSSGMVTIGSTPHEPDGVPLLSAPRRDHPDLPCLLFYGAYDCLSIHFLLGDQVLSFLMKEEVLPLHLSVFSGRWGK